MKDEHDNLRKKLLGLCMFNEHVRRFCFLRVDHMDVVVLLDGARTARHPVGVEHKDEVAFLVALIVAQNVHQLMPGGFQILSLIHI